MPGWEAILDWIYFTAKVWIHRKKFHGFFFCFLHITITATKNIADTQALMIDDFNTDVAELIKLAFLQFSCFHLLNLPDEFSTKTHMVLKIKILLPIMIVMCNFCNENHYQSSPNSFDTFITSSLWSYGISLLNKVVWGIPADLSSKRNPPTSSLVLTNHFNLTVSSDLSSKKMDFKWIYIPSQNFIEKVLLSNVSELNVRIDLEFGSLFGLITY